MEEDLILITWLNDYIFCPASIYFHNLYGSSSEISFQETSQINGSAAHEKIDQGQYSNRNTILSGVSVSCEKYGLIGKIDIFEIDTGRLIERKKKITTIYDGYVFQLYAQYYALIEMGYTIKEIYLRSLSDNRRYKIALPEDDPVMLAKFEKTIQDIRNIELTSFKQENKLKCQSCIYEPLCDSSLA